MSAPVAAMKPEGPLVSALSGHGNVPAQVSEPRLRSPNVAATDVLAVNRVGFLGGVERVILTAAEGVAARGWTTGLACPPGDLAEEATVRSIPVRPVEVCSLSRARALRSPLAWARTVRELRAGGEAIFRAASLVGARIIHVHHPAVALQAMGAARRLDARLIWHVHETAPMTLAYRALGMAVVGACDLILCVSEASRQMVRELRPPQRTRLRLVYNAVDSRFLGQVAPSDELRGAGPHVGVFGVLEPRKGHADLIRACAVLRQRWPRLQLWIVGGTSFAQHGPLRDTLQALAQQLGIGERVHFLGRRRDVPELMARMDAVVSAAVGSESLPTVLIEAAALGVPIVGTDVGGTREIIRHGETGLLVTPAAVSELAMGLDAALSPAGRRMAERGRAEARLRFSPARFAGELADCYQQLTWPQREGQR